MLEKTLARPLADIYDKYSGSRWNFAGHGYDIPISTTSTWGLKQITQFWLWVTAVLILGCWRFCVLLFSFTSQAFFQRLHYTKLSSSVEPGISDDHRLNLYYLLEIGKTSLWSLRIILNQPSFKSWPALFYLELFAKQSIWLTLDFSIFNS